MSLRRRSKPVIAASAVAKARSRASEKSDNVSEIENKVQISGQQLENENEEGQKSPISNLIKDPEITNSKNEKGPGEVSNDVLTENEPVPPSSRTDEVVNSDLNASLSKRKRFTKVRPTPNLNRKKIKLEKQDDIDGNDLNEVNEAKDVLDISREGRFRGKETDVASVREIVCEADNERSEGTEKRAEEFDASSERPNSLGETLRDETIIEETIIEETITEEIVAEDMIMEEMITSSEEMGNVSSINEYKRFDVNSGKNKNSDELSYSGFIVTEQEITDILPDETNSLLGFGTGRVEEGEANSKANETKLESSNTNRVALDQNIATEKKSTQNEMQEKGNDDVTFVSSQCEALENDCFVIPKVEGKESEKSASISSIKGRFKKSRFTPNIGKSKPKIGNARDESGGNAVSNSGMPDTNDKGENKVSDHADVGKETKQDSKRFRRSSIKPTISFKRLGKTNMIKNEEDNILGMHKSKENDNDGVDLATETADSLIQKTGPETRKAVEIPKSVSLNDLAENEELSSELKRSEAILENEKGNGVSEEQTRTSKNDKADGENVKMTENPVTLQTEDAETKKSDIDKNKKPRRLGRARFKPNVNTKEKKNGNKDGTDSLSQTNEMLGDSVLKGNNKSKENGSETISREKGNSEKDSVGKKHVRFTPNVGQSSAEKNITGEDEIKENNNEGSGQVKNTVGKDIKKNEEVRSGSMSHSDLEDGSQSESEGLHHHGKRKFAPCLGPRVRQRRRLSSMTLSEDEGGAAEGKAADANDAAGNKSFVISNSKSEKTDKVAETGNESDISTVAKKKKRTRIVIKQPKEKMTMFDYIYYNPNSAEKDKAASEESSTAKKRREDEANILPESETILETLTTDKSEPSKKNGDLKTEKLNKGEDLDEEDNAQILAPQIRIGEDGNIVIDEESLVLKTTRSKMSLEEANILYDDGNSFNPYRKRKDVTNYKKRWPVEETLKFYRALSRVGTDFSLMVQFFPNCTRRNLKHKFKTEEKYNGDLVDRALKHMLPMDEALFDELGAKKEQEAIDKAENPTKTKNIPNST